MLPPQLQQGLRPRSLSMPAAMTIGSSASSMLRASASAAQSRGYWGWRRQADYASHIDPQFQRFCRYRTLKTRAKLLDKLRRRGRWDWDADQRPFFSPRHVRLASHIGRPRWRNNDEGGEKKDTAKEAAEEDGYELSQREREWKEQMEAMRKRIEQDPYEAVFGKRFEPFWSPLVPTWMREEMGLSRWSKSKEPIRTHRPTSILNQEVGESNKEKNDSDVVQPNGQLTEYAYPENKKPASSTVDPDSPNGQLTSYSYSRKKPASESPDSPNGQLTSYSYSSTTSWDSWTQKARKDEWDSLSGQRRRFEYDPISNRMVQIQSPVTKLSEVIEEPILADNVTKQSDRVLPQSVQNTSVDVPVKTSTEPRKAIIVPTESAEDSQRKTSRYFPSLIISANPTLETGPAAVSEYPERALDRLTADDVRASVRKPKQRRDERSKQEPARLVTDAPGDKQSSQHIQDALLRGAEGKTEWISAQIKETEAAEQPADNKLETAIDRTRRAPSNLDSARRILSALQPAVERMQSKELPVAAEPDDSAAHESTGEAIDMGATNLPRGWESQADLLQIDRIRRTRGSSQVAESSSVKSSTDKSRWIDIMNARKAEYEAKVIARQAADEARDAEKNLRSRKADSMLEAEIKDQKLRLMAYENRYAHGALAEIQQNLQAVNPKKTELTTDVQNERQRYQQKIRDLRKELDTSFKQSSVNSEMHLERIRDLEKELTSRSFGHDTLQVEKDRYKQKSQALKEELDRTFKQSSANSEMQVERIRDLERELAKARSNKPEPTRGIEATRAEGDFCANVTKYAKDNSKWYKKPCYVLDATGKPSRAEIEEAAYKSKIVPSKHEVQDLYEERYGPVDTMKSDRRSKDQALINEIKDIYEVSYGAIDTMKSEPQAVKADAETDIDLGKALADYEKEQEYNFCQPQRTLEAEIAADEKAAHEAQALLDPYPLSCAGISQAKASSPSLDQDTYSARLADEKAAPIIPAPASSASSIEWEEPPIYKILAHDSGNDLLTTAVTSSNVTGQETPISIPQALSELYQPARFVPHFAELQREGFQVIFGSKDLLVFKKVKSTTTTQSQAGLSLEDHGMVKEATTSPKGSKPYPAGVNPIDGMSHSVEPNTGSFASPTGFVGDRWDTEPKSDAEPADTAANTTRTSPNQVNTRRWEEEDDTDIRHYPRVRREEQVFSGSRIGRRKTSRREAKETKRKWRGWRSRIQWALGVGLGASAVAYGVGAIAERKQNRDVERWQQILDGRRSRWE